MLRTTASSRHPYEPLPIDARAPRGSRETHRAFSVISLANGITDVSLLLKTLENGKPLTEAKVIASFPLFAYVWPTIIDDMGSLGRECLQCIIHRGKSATSTACGVD